MEDTHSIRSDIQGMRALAVMAVIAYHFMPRLLPNGYLGVDIFFVISGFVITGSLSRIREQRVSTFFLRFFERRVRRLLPALITCVAVTAAAGLPFITPGSSYFTVSWRTGIASLFGMSSFYLYRQALDYFGFSSAFNLFTQTWSLGVEEQFYLLFPFMAWFCGIGRKDDATGSRFLKALAVGSAISLLLFVRLGRTNPAASFFLVTSRFWELGAGAMTFLSLRALTRSSILVAPFVRTGALAGIVALLAIPDLDRTDVTVVVVMLTVILMIAPRRRSPADQLLESKQMVFVGSISYSLYLWHWSVLAVSRWTVGVRLSTAPFQVALIFLLAYLSFSCVEQPLRKRPWLSSRARNVAAGLSAAVACAAVLAVLGASRLGVRIFLGDVGPDRPKLTGTALPPGGISRSPSFSRFQSDVDRIVRYCNLTPHRVGQGPKPDVDRAFLDRCLSGEKAKVVLVGDSFAQVIAPDVAFAAYQVGRDFKMLIGYEWPYPLDLRNVAFHRSSSCEFEIDLIRREVIRQLNQGDVLVLRLFFGKPSYLDLSERGLVSPPSPESSGGLLAAYDAELSSLNRQVSARGARLLIVGANPSVKYTPVCESPQWFNRWQQLDCERLLIPTSLLTRFALQQEAHLLRVSSGGGDFSARVIAATSIICPTASDACSLVRGGEYLWGDEHHIKPAAADLLYPEILGALRAWTP